MRLVTPMGVLVGLSLLSGCGSSSSTPVVNVTGRWVRPVTIMGSSLSMTLQESGTQVSGAGNWPSVE